MCMIVQQFPVITNNNAITERRGIGGGWAGERGWKVGKKLFYKHEKEAVTRESLEGVERADRREKGSRVLLAMTDGMMEK